MQNIKEELGGAEWYFTSALWQPHTDDYVNLLSNSSFFTESNWEKVRTRLAAYNSVEDIDAGRNIELVGSGVTGRDFSLYLDVGDADVSGEYPYIEGATNSSICKEKTEDKDNDGEEFEDFKGREEDVEEEELFVEGDGDMNEDKRSDVDEDLSVGGRRYGGSEGEENDAGGDSEDGEGKGEREEDEASIWDSATDGADF